MNTIKEKKGPLDFLTVLSILEQLGEFDRTEFFVTGGDVLFKLQDAPVRTYEPVNTKLTQALIPVIKTFYPETYSALCEIYTKVNFNKYMYEYKIVHRFIRCNFGEYDCRPDIKHGCFNFEDVKCPLRKECLYENIICRPRFNANLSDREMEVMGKLYDGYSIEQSAEICCISIATVRTHRRNVFIKLGLHSLSEFQAFARRTKLFEQL